MFLSMVAAPNERFATLTAPQYKQRFNVAVSRARDQLWLFHTVSLNDLNKECLRYALLRHCQNPLASNAAIAGLAVDELRRIARDARRDRETPPAPFDSWFEVDVFLAITQRGYRVIPQYKVSHYSIDLVVEGPQGRVAVECDGDEWHGAEKFQADMDRQRILERSGLRFCRIRGGSFYRQPEAALESLWEQLHRHGVEPWLGADNSVIVLEGHVPNESPEAAGSQDALCQVQTPQEVEIPVKTASPRPKAKRARGARSVSQSGAAALDGGVSAESTPATTNSPVAQGPPQVSHSSEPVGADKSAVAAQPNLPGTGDTDAELVDFVQSIDAGTWFSLSHWARVNEAFQPWARSMLYSVGRRVAQGVPVTVKQARQAKRFYEEGIAKGFDPDADKQPSLFS